MSQRRTLVITNVPLVAVLFLVGCSGQGQNSQSAIPTSPSSVMAAPSTASQSSQFVEDTAASSTAATRTIDVCSLENVISVSDGAQHPGDAANSYKVSKGVAYKLIGFATDKAAARVPGKIKLVLSGAKRFVRDAETGGDRPDVAEYFKVPAFSHAGYQVDASFDLVPAGTYDVVILETDASAMCPTHQTLTVN